MLVTALVTLVGEALPGVVAVLKVLVAVGTVAGLTLELVAASEFTLASTAAA
jgi:hypothetical protein